MFKKKTDQEKLEEALKKLPVCFCSHKHEDTARSLFADGQITIKEMGGSKMYGYLHISTLILRLGSDNNLLHLLALRTNRDMRLKSFTSGIGMLSEAEMESDVDRELFMMGVAALLLDYANEEV